jgi:hypothetical protein
MGKEHERKEGKRHDDIRISDLPLDFDRPFLLPLFSMRLGLVNKKLEIANRRYSLLMTVEGILLSH